MQWYTHHLPNAVRSRLTQGAIPTSPEQIRRKTIWTAGYSTPTAFTILSVLIVNDMSAISHVAPTYSLFCHLKYTGILAGSPTRMLSWCQKIRHQPICAGHHLPHLVMQI